MTLKAPRYNTFRIFVPLLAFCVAGCAGAQTRDISGEVELGTHYSGSALFDEAPPLQVTNTRQNGWWRLYNDGELDALMALAFQDNPGLNQTRARLEQASAQARKSGSAFWPDASVTGSRKTTRGDNRTPSDFSLIGAASYELDVWGGNRAAFKADALQAESSVEDLRAAAITLSAAITENWLRLLAAREEEALLRKQIDTNATLLDLQIKRFTMGTANALGALQQKETLARSQSRLPDILARQDVLLHKISILSGRSPSLAPALSGHALPDPLPLPQGGVPSALLADRPDLIAAWLDMRSADWAVQAAVADRLPDFTLSANYSTTAMALDGLFNTWLLNMAANVAMPLLDGGNRRAEVFRQRAIADERFHAYREKVLAAVSEVEDALSLNYHQGQELQALDAQLEASRDALQQAQISYTNGDQSYINILSGLNNVQNLEQQIVQERLNLHLDRLELYRALGGRSWTHLILEKQEEAI